MIGILMGDNGRTSPHSRSARRCGGHWRWHRVSAPMVVAHKTILLFIDVGGEACEDNISDVEDHMVSYWALNNDINYIIFL
jgi:hypothetical protein